MKSNKAVVKMMHPPMGDQSIAPLVEEMLRRLGEDPKRDGLARTPQRVDKALRFLTSGYQMKVEQILNGALYEVKYDEMVVVRDIEFFSLCEHHMLPFYGKMHVAYLPQKKVIGLSKIPRIVDMFARRLQIQERLTQQMAHEVKNSLTPIRLTVEEMLVRYDDADRGFMEQATQIVVDEIETLERRIRAFSQFATEPPVEPGPVDVNGLLQERIAFLKTAHPEVAYDCRLVEYEPPVVADQDLLKGILTNLLENAAEAAGEGGRIQIGRAHV